MLNRRILISLALCIGCSAETNEKPKDATSDLGTKDMIADSSKKDAAEKNVVRIASFNTSLYGDEKDELIGEFADGNSQRGQAIAEILQINRPDIVLLNEFDWDASGEGAKLFSDNYLTVSQNGAEPIEYSYRYIPSSNTGLSTGIDLNGDGEIGADENTQAYGDDSFGFGRFPGQYGMVVFSKYPIADNAIRSFQNLLWKDMTNNLLPTDFYSTEAVDIFRLSSKNHVDVPIDIDGKTVHFLISHPTPPSFDGDEDRNGKRNHDEIRFWLDYISGDNADYIKDDNGMTGALGDASFFIAGDLNSDPIDAESRREALTSLLAHPRVSDTQPSSEGGPEDAVDDGQANTIHEGDSKLDTADFSDRSVGNLRVDYALPSADLSVVDSGVFWPTKDDNNAQLIRASDHRLVWVDLEF